MILRAAEAAVRRFALGAPVIALTGPRQSGTTTLGRAVFADRPYAPLEDPQEREFAQRGPRGLLARFDDGDLLDEAQCGPGLFACLQGVVGERRRVGDFITTGAPQLGLLSGVSQSLAVRVGLVQLLPFALDELAQAGCRPARLDPALCVGGPLATHAQRGALFETLVHAEPVKQAFNAVRLPELHVWRDRVGYEVDRVFGYAGRLQGVELKSGATFAGEWLQALQRWRQLARGAVPQTTIVHGAEASCQRAGMRLLAGRVAAQSLESVA